MRLNIINNYKTIYYNFIASFYLCLNSIFPYYDDVIISIQSQAIKLLIDNDTLNMKKIKKIRMIEFIDALNKSDKIILDKEKDIIVIDYHIYESNESNESNESTSDPEPESEPEPESDSNTNDTGANEKTDKAKDSERTSSDSDPDKDPYEPRKKKSRIDNDYTPLPFGPVGNAKDTGYYYNMDVCAVSATAATAVANNAAKNLIEDSGGNSADTTDTTDSADTDDRDRYDLDKEIDVSIRNIIQNIIYDKNKDD
jgi:hypothetical protein